MLKALIVENEIALRLICLRTLRTLDYTVACVNDGDEAILHLTSDDYPTPNLLLMNVLSPNDSGLRLIDYLEKSHEQTQTMHIILMSSNKEHQRFATKYRHWDFIRKPVLPRQLIGLVNRFNAS